MENYFTYLPVSPAVGLWGCCATSAGYTRIPPDSPYPPVPHPEDHQFRPVGDRMLQAYQIVLISEGRGRFACGDGAPTRVEPGSVFLLFPGVRHRYEPDAATGWVEHWLECRGAVFDRARHLGLISTEQSVRPDSLSPEMADTFARIHGWASRDAISHQDLLSTLGLHLLALLLNHAGQRVSDPHDRILQKARMLILEQHNRPLKMQNIAEELGLSYSRFRQLFKQRLGVSPKHYHLQLRVSRACGLLAETDQSIKEIAGDLGFHSAAHFSSQFRNAVGESPGIWRQRHQGQAGNAGLG